MKKYIVGIAAGIALCFAGFALASGDVMCPPVAKKGGIIIGAEAGWGEITTPEAFTELDNYNADVYEKYSQDLGDFVWGAHLGYAHQLANTGWLCNMMLGLEAGYKDLGKSTYSYKVTPPVAPGSGNIEDKVEYSGYGIDALLTAHYFIWQGWNAFVKGGVIVLNPKVEVSHTDSAASVENPNYSIDHDSWNMRPEVELGTGYTFDLAPAMHLDVHIMYVHIATEPGAGMAFGNAAHGQHSTFGVNVPGMNAALGGLDFSFNPSV